MIMYVVTIVNEEGRILAKRIFDNKADRQTYAEVMTKIISKIENKETMDVREKILKENPDLERTLEKAVEVVDRVVIAEMLVNI